MGKIWKLTSEYQACLKEDMQMNEALLDQQLKEKKGFFWDQVNRRAKLLSKGLDKAFLLEEKQRTLKDMNQTSEDYYNRLAAFNDMSLRLSNEYDLDFVNALINPEPALPISEMSNEDVEYFEEQFTLLLSKTDRSQVELIEFFSFYARPGVYRDALSAEQSQLDEREAALAIEAGQLKKQIEELTDRLSGVQKMNGGSKWEGISGPLSPSGTTQEGEQLITDAQDEAKPSSKY